MGASDLCLCSGEKHVGSFPGAAHADGGWTQGPPESFVWGQENRKNKRKIVGEEVAGPAVPIVRRDAQINASSSFS